MSHDVAPPPARGLFVAFEGGDGAGKSTQVRLLAQALEAAGREVLLTRQPGGTPLGAEIRRLVMHGGHVSPRAEALLYAADKAHHVDELIRPTAAGTSTTMVRSGKRPPTAQSSRSWISWGPRSRPAP